MHQHLSLHDGKEVLIAPCIPWPVSGPSAKLIFEDSRLQENKGIQGVFRRLCSQIPDGFPCRNMQRAIRYSLNGNRTELEQVVQSHTSNIAPERLAVRVWCTKSQSSLLNIYFHISGFSSSLLLIYRLPGPSQTMEPKPFPMCNDPLSRSARRCLAVRMCEPTRYSMWFSYRRVNFRVADVA